jgi:hypothetical protein
VSLQGYVETIRRDVAGYAAARERYLARFPAAAPMFELTDFALVRFVTVTARYVSGFGRVHRLGPAELRSAAAIFEG